MFNTTSDFNVHIRPFIREENLDGGQRDRRDATASGVKPELLAKFAFVDSLSIDLGYSLYAR